MRKTMMTSILGIRYPSTYTPSSTGTCTFSISKISSDICQVLQCFHFLLEIWKFVIRKSALSGFITVTAIREYIIFFISNGIYICQLFTQPCGHFPDFQMTQSNLLKSPQYFHHQLQSLQTNHYKTPNKYSPFSHHHHANTHHHDDHHACSYASCFIYIMLIITMLFFITFILIIITILLIPLKIIIISIKLIPTKIIIITIKLIPMKIITSSAWTSKQCQAL